MTDGTDRRQLAEDALQVATNAREESDGVSFRLTTYTRLIGLSETLARALLEAENDLYSRDILLDYAQMLINGLEADTGVEISEFARQTLWERRRSVHEE